MTIHNILLLVGLSIALAWLTRIFQRVNLLMAASILVMFWLQPETNLRYLGFWLPSFGLLLIILSWAAITPAVVRRQPQTFSTLVLSAVLVGVVAGIDYFDTAQVMGFVKTPSLMTTVLGITAIGILSLPLTIRQGDHNFWSWLPFAIILTIFIIIKTPVLAEAASRLWRSLSNQSLDLASEVELMWLGYSYLAFRLLHTIRDSQTGRYVGVPLNQYIAYVLFFPSLIAGPIARINQVENEIRVPANTFPDSFQHGSRRLLTGLFKKFVIADSLAIFALNSQNALLPTSSLGAWLLLYAYSFQIYLDFSGYTDIAIGLAAYLGIKLPENFNRPYLKPNLTQFWSNWHMTLTNWFRAYFFNPISRSLRRNKLPALSILFITQLSTMILVGLWHGVTINFVIWGAWHGIGLLIQNRWSSWTKTFLQPTELSTEYQFALQSFGTILTFHYVTLGWIWFVLPSPAMAQTFLISLAGGG